MSHKSPLTIILGTGNVGSRSIDKMARFSTPKEVNAFLDYFYSRGYRHIDTARGYSPHAAGTSEPLLGIVGAGKRFNIDTKLHPFGEHPHGKQNVEQSINESLGALDVAQVDIQYLHMPDRTTPFEETCEAMDKAFREGKFKRFGISNHSAEEVEQIIQICEKKGFVKPTVYQGQYNAVARAGEKGLFPTLRKHGMAFYAYSPTAGGLFTGNHKKEQTGGRYDPSHMIGQNYSAMYLKTAVESAVDAGISAAAKHGISGHSAALRWTVYHGILDPKHGDSVIIGASSVEQLKQNLDVIAEGPLPEDVAAAYGKIYEGLGKDEIPYHF